MCEASCRNACFLLMVEVASIFRVFWIWTTPHDRGRKGRGWVLLLDLELKRCETVGGYGGRTRFSKWAGRSCWKVNSSEYVVENYQPFLIPPDFFGLCSHLFLKQSLKWIKCLSLRFVVVLGWLHGAGLLNGWRDCNEQTVAGCTLLHLLTCVFECKTQYLHVYITTYDFWIHKCPRFSTHPWWNYLSCSA